MKNLQYYPTPTELGEKMIEGIRELHTVLEPSAGTGDLAEVVREKFKNADIDCIELDADRRAVLKSKKLRVVYDNFFGYTSFKTYDLIIMNPPFSDGEKHLKKAIQMQKRNGGSISCLLNAETIRNPYSFERKELVRELEEHGASIEFFQEAFVDAKVATNVEVALIKVSFPCPETDSVILADLRRVEEEKEGQPEANQLIDADFIKAIVQRYEFEVRAGVKLIREYKALSPYIMSFFENDNVPNMYKDKKLLNLDITDENEYARRVRAKYWNALFKTKNLLVI